MGTLSVDKILRTSTGASEFTLPATDGTVGQVMQTDGAGQLSVAALAADTVTATQIAAGAVGTSEIAVNAVTLAEMAGLTRGSIIVGDASGDPSALTKGTANQVLTSDGTDLSWAAAAGGGSLVKLLSTTISGAVAAIAFNSTYVTTTYSKYMLMWEGVVPSTDAHSLAIGLSVDNGSSFPTHVGQFVYHQINAGSVFGTNGNLAYYPANTDITNTGSHGGASGYAYIYNTLSTSQNKYITGMGAQTNNTTANSYGFTSFGKVFTTSAINYMKLYEPEAGGNFSAGTATLYGIET